MRRGEGVLSGVGVVVENSNLRRRPGGEREEC